MAEHQEYDFSELAIVTFIQALALGKPISLLPAVMLNRFHHGSIVKKTGGPIEEPKDLNGKKIGVPGLYPDDRRMGARHPRRGVRRRS